MPGEVLRAVVRTPFHPAEGVLAIAHGAMVETRRLCFDGATQTIAVPLTDAHAPHIDLVVAVAGKQRHGQARLHVTVEPTAQRLGVERRVHFLGPRPLPQLGAYLRQADVLVSPRIAGTNTPMKIYSYLDSGRPVVATRLPAHTQVLDDEIACLVDPTPEDLAEGLVRLFRDAELRMLLARRARERFPTWFSRPAVTTPTPPRTVPSRVSTCRPN